MLHSGLSNLIVSCRVVSCRVVSCRVLSCLVVLQRVEKCEVLGIQSKPELNGEIGTIEDYDSKTATATATATQSIDGLISRRLDVLPRPASPGPVPATRRISHNR